MMKAVLTLMAFCLLMAAPARATELETLSIRTKGGQTHIFEVEQARTVEEMQRGLMFRKEIPAGHGMIFVFPEEGERSFWMKNTLVPLDMIFIKGDGVIHHIHHNAIPHDLTGIPSNGPVSRVLEVAGGTAAALNIQKGDRVYNEGLFGNKLAE